MTAVRAEEAPAASRPRLRFPTWCLAIPATLALLALFVTPLLIFTFYAFFEGAFYEVSRDFTLANFGDAVSSSLARHLAANALIVGSLTAVICVALALPLAYFIRYHAGRFEYPLLFLMVLVLPASYLVRLYAWRTVLGEDGLLNQSLDAIGLPTVGALLFSRTAVVIALVHIFLPYVTLVVYASFRNLPRELIDLAADLGAGPLRRWRSVVLPLVAPAAAAGLLFTFILSTGDYVAPQFLGGTDGNMIGVLIQQQFTQVGNFPLGAAMSLVMLALFLGFYAALATLLRVLGLTRVAVRY